MGRTPTPSELAQYAKWYFPVAGVLCTAGAFALNSGVQPWNAIGSIAIVVSIIGFFPLAGNLMAMVVGTFMSLLAPPLCRLIHRVFQLCVPEPGSNKFFIDESDFGDSGSLKALFWYGGYLLFLGVIGAVAVAVEHRTWTEIVMVVGAFSVFPLAGGVFFTFAISALVTLVEIGWLAGRIVAWLMRKIAPQSSPLSGLCGAGLVLTGLFGWISHSADIPAEQWQGRAILLMITFGGFLMLIWPLADARKSSLPALVLVAGGSTAFGLFASRLSPAAGLFLALACFLWVEAFRRLRSTTASQPQSRMAARIAASVVLGAALEGGILLYAAHTAPRAPEALVPPDPEKTLVER